MCCGNEELSGITVSMSRGAGTCVGMVAAVGKKITGVVTGGVKAVGHLLTRPVDTPELIAAKQTEPMSEGFDIEGREARAEQEESAKSLSSALESDLAEAQRELKKAQSNAEKAHSKLASKLGDVKAEKESLISDLEQVRKQANEASVRQAELKTRVAALESDLTAAQRRLEMPHKKEGEGVKSQPPSEMSLAQREQEAELPKPVEEVVVGAGEEKIGSSTETVVPHFDKEVSVKSKEQPSQAASEIEMPSPPAVTDEPRPSEGLDEQVQAAVFDKATDKILFAKAVSDIVNQDVIVRLDAVKTMAGIGHELSVKALVAQVASDPSTQVRQECIKALTALEMKEALPAVERALTDEAGSVRLVAVWGLYHLAGTESVPALIRMFTDKNEEVRRRAATCIGWLGKGRFAADLTILLDDDSVLVRRAAAEAMGNLNNRQVVLPMIEHLKDPDEATRKAVLCAIEKITGKKIGKSFPGNEADIDRLIARWRQWWEEDMLN